MELEKFDQKSLLSELQRIFDNKEIEQLARSTGFIQRSTSRLCGESFLLMNVFDSTNGKERSLNDSCDWLEEHFDIVLTKQSLDERYNTDSVRFIKSCFSRTLEIVNQGIKKKEECGSFSVIQLTDSTTFQIPPNLATFYKGYKGNGGKAILKMHFNYDLLNGGVADILLTDGAANDNLYKLGATEQIKQNGLYIRDLGYFDLDYLNDLASKDAYFLSRSKSNAVYSRKDENGKYVRINMEEELPKEGMTKELSDVYVGGGKTKVGARLIMQAVPEHVALKRLEKLEQYASKHKNLTISEQRKSMCYFNMYITNAPEESLPATLVRLVYTLRWQIELIFKIWKSVFKIDKVKKMSIFRFECYIYSKLIGILLTLHIHNRFGHFLWEEYDFELSPIKAAKLIKKNCLI